MTKENIYVILYISGRCQQAKTPEILLHIKKYKRLIYAKSIND